MLQSRIIPCLLLKGQGLVKGSQFKAHKYIGDPINAVRIFNDKEVDELVFLDISATLEGRGPNYDLLSDIASECFMPFAYGGGINSFEQAKQLFSLGVEKIVLNSSVYENPNLINEIATVYGNQSVIVSIDVKKNFWGNYELYSHSGSKKRSEELFDQLKKVERLGAGEVLITSIDKEGLGKGLDIKLIHKVVDHLGIPVIASGGAGSLNDMKEVLKLTNSSGVAAGSFFVFHGKHKAVLITYPSVQELQSLI